MTAEPDEVVPHEHEGTPTFRREPRRNRRKRTGAHRRAQAKRWVRANSLDEGETATGVARETARAARALPIAKLNPQQRAVIAAANEHVARRDKGDTRKKSRKAASAARKKNR